MRSGRRSKRTRRADRRPFLSAWFLLVSAAVGFGQERAAIKVYPDASHTADTLLRNADNMARDNQFGAALDIYQRVIAQFGDKVVEVPNPKPGADPTEETHLFVSARFDCQRRIAALPPEGRALYRSRVDGQAKRWYDAGRAERDRALLRRVVEEAYCSSWGDDALELLGDLAFQEGRFGEALAAYRRLTSEPGASPSGLAHPDPSVDLARVAAKALLARAGLGPTPPAKSEVDALAKRFPNAKGSLAGRDDETYAAIVTDVLTNDGITAVAATDLRWPTFAGSPTRNRIAAGSLDVGALQWKVKLEPSTGPTRQPSRFRGGFGRGPQFDNLSPPPPDRRLAYHPIIVGEQVVLCNTREVVAYDLAQRPQNTPGMPPADPKPAWRQESRDGMDTANRVFLTLARYTLTAYGDRIYARMGPPPILNSTNAGGRMNAWPQVFNESVIVALDRKADGKSLWRKTPAEIPLPNRKPNDENRTLVFDGTPVVDADGVYVVMTDRVEMTEAYVVCLHPDTGALKWVKYICAANANVDRIVGNSATELSSRLLTLDGPSLYFQTNLGAVAAIETQNGAIRWIATYPWEGKATTGQERDLNPAVVADGLVIVAPDDAPAIFAYDAMTGRLVWKTKNFPEEVKLTHLLGVAKGRVVATGNRVYLFDVKNGELFHTWPDSGQAPDALGRGVLSGDKIYWPTKNEIHVLDQATGLRTEPPIKLYETFGTTGGNLAVGDGYLLVAGEDSLVVFAQNRRLIERFREEIARAPDQAINYYRLAIAAETAGLTDLAMEHLGLALAKAKANEAVDGLPLADAVRDHQHRIFVQQGYAAKEREDWDVAAAKFARAAEIARVPRDRLNAVLQLAEVQTRGDKLKEAVATFQSVLADPRLRPIVIQVADGRRAVRADLLVVDRLGELIKTHGRAPYAEFDREAEALSRKFVLEKTPRPLEDLTRVMPLAASTPDSLLAMGGLYEAEGRFNEAARAYKRLEAGDSPEKYEIAALLGQARAHEARNLFVPARNALLLAKSKFPEAVVRDGSVDVKLSDLVDRRLSAKVYARLGGAVGPSVEMPLVRKQLLSWNRGRRPLAADGVPPSVEAGRIFLVDGTKISPVEPGRNAARWSFDLEGDPVWVGYLSDKIVVGTRTKLVGLSPSKGTPLWELDAGKQGDRPNANVFEQTDGEESDGPSGLHEFRILDNRIVCMRDDRNGRGELEKQTILSIDGESGQVEWTFTPLMGKINPNWLVARAGIVFQVVDPGGMVVLDAETGRKRVEKQLDTNTLWRRPPELVQEDKAAIVTDLRTVALFDLEKAVELWHFRESLEAPTYGPPRILVHGRNLFVLHDGRWIISLDPTNGGKRWDRLISEKDLSERPESIRLGSEALFYVTGNELHALSPADGRPIWTKPLIGLPSGWSIELTSGHVVAFPNLGRVIDADQSAWPIVIRSRKNGEIAQRLLIPAAARESNERQSRASSSDLIVDLSPKATLVATRSGLWSLIERSP